LATRVCSKIFKQGLIEKNGDERQNLSGTFDEKVRTFSCQIAGMKNSNSTK
jgi:hypothetical protein